MLNNISFLLGAGISSAVGLKNTAQLTNDIIETENVVRISSKYFYHQNPQEFHWDFYNNYIPKIQELFKILKKHFSVHYAFFDRKMNYEDYYYLISSLYKDENMDYENPIVSFFSEFLLSNYSSLFDPLDPHLERIRLIELCNEAEKYIKDLITSSLNVEPQNLNHLSFLEEAIDENKKIQIDIFTLNHDLIIEKYLNKKSIKYSTGFANKNEDINIWEFNSFTENVCLFKLHGSINWYYESAENLYEDKYCIYNNEIRNNESPQLLIGSLNKLQEYTRGIYFELQSLFYRRLNKINNLVISGYSFGDQGINSRIINWLLKSKDNKVVIIHPDAENLKHNSRSAIHNKWGFFVKSGALRIIPKYIEKVSWLDIKEQLQ